MPLGLLHKSSFLVAVFISLTACNQTSTSPQPAPVPNSSSVPGVTAAGFRLPDGAGCSGEVARFRAIMANDLETGHTTKPVFDRVNAEINQAASACAAGRDGDGTRMVRATRTKFGYP